MCNVNVRVNDIMMARMKTQFSGDDAMQKWIEDALDKAMSDYLEQFGTRRAKEARGDEILQRIAAVKDDPDGFFKLGGILGRPHERFSWDELREEALFEKYGI